MTDRVQPEGTPSGSTGGESKTAPHPTSIAVWGVPSPVLVNRRFVARVGVKCPAGCPLAGRTIVIRDGTGADVGQGRLGDAPERGTSALYAAGVTLEAPAEEGVHAWTAAFAGWGPDDASRAREAPPARETAPPRGPLSPSEQAPPHAGATAAFSFRTVVPPEHRVTVTVLDEDAKTPLAGAEVRMGVHWGTTDASGRAHVKVHSGSYDLYVRKAGYKPHSERVPAVSGDLALQVTATRVSDADLDDDQVWM